MTLFTLLIKELKQRKRNFILGVASVTIAVAVFLGSILLLTSHENHIRLVLEDKIQDTQKRTDVLKDDYRKIMKELGFNLLILPQDQNLTDFYTNNFAAKTMPEEYVEKLAASSSMSIRHLLPSLERKILWPEAKRHVLLVGIRGEVPLLYRAPKEPMMQAVPKGRVVVGYDIHTTLDLKAGDTIKVLGQSFVIETCYPERGSRDDISLWIDLQQAQKLLNQPGRINAILALKCLCAGNSLDSLRKEINAILPDVQIIEKQEKVTTRAHARQRASKEATDAVFADRQNKQQQLEIQKKFATLFIPFVLLLCMVWLYILFTQNANERKNEIGILMAVGVRPAHIILLFLAKAFLICMTGAAVGTVAGILVCITASYFKFKYITFGLLAGSWATAFLVTLISTWPPAFSASRQDPAIVLAKED